MTAKRRKLDIASLLESQDPRKTLSTLSPTIGLHDDGDINYENPFLGLRQQFFRGGENFTQHLSKKISKRSAFLFSRGGSDLVNDYLAVLIDSM
jgi:hypothetical protein